MIPSTTNKVFVTEDWKKIYQSFTNADFKSYDFETLKRTMINYLQENFPEDFNDYIDSSEYIALIDLIAYLGQNLSFRIDLNARENFLETAQRRDSILRLAQLISYNPSRNIPANGFLKLTAISTTDNVFDNNGTNLANATIGWNDATNPDWYQQFLTILNSAMTSAFGDPIDKKTIDNILTEQYRINNANEGTPVYSFNTNIDGISMGFEVVPCTFAGQNFVYEEAPRPANQFSFIYKDDNKGSSSPNNGFFVHFRQGNLSLTTFSIENPVPNEIVGVNTPNINNTDVWLWQLDRNGVPTNLWTKVSSLLGNNIIYNSIDKNIRQIYSITSRDEDQIDLNFADGVFGDLPKGDFVLFYRQSNGLTYVIKPDQLNGIVITIPYFNSLGQTQSLQLTFSLQYTVTNSTGSESNRSIQTKAPQVYYTQNRMITGEDYNIAPLTAGSDVLKVKSINRISSGLSRYFDISDVTGRYSRTNIFGDDGILYKEQKELTFEFRFSSRGQILSVIKNTLAPIINSAGLKSLYLDKYSKIDVSSFNASWTEVNQNPKESRGYFSIGSPIDVGSQADGDFAFILPGAEIKFTAPSGKYFDSRNNRLKNIPNSGIPVGGRTYIWVSVKQIIGDGSNNGSGALIDGTGPVILNDSVPSTARLSQILPKYINILPFAVENEIANICLTQRNFGLSFDQDTRTWNIILNSNLNLVDPFSLSNQNNVENAGLDASWLVAFIWTGTKYIVRYRTLNYIFESKNQTSFFIDQSSINYDFISNTVVKDKIDVLAVNRFANTGTNVDFSWQIESAIVEVDGYIQPKKVNIGIYEKDDVGTLVDPESFINIVNPDEIDSETESRINFVYFKKSSDASRYELTEEIITAYPNESVFYIKNPVREDIEDNSLYYFYDDQLDVVKFWSTATNDLVFTDQYFGRTGRSNLKFNYIHNSSDDRRIDPSKSNIIDIYLLTLSYDTEYRNWLAGFTTVEPLPPTSQSLSLNFGTALDSIKAISDEIIFHPVKYRVLFGDKAEPNLQGIFKAVKNSNRPTTDNDLKSRILEAISDFFSLENWDFGQKFNFGELSAYVMNRLTPDITNFIIVPKNAGSFGSLYEITCALDELFISNVTANDIEIIDAITASQLKSEQEIITSTGS